MTRTPRLTFVLPFPDGLLRLALVPQDSGQILHSAHTPGACRKYVSLVGNTLTRILGMTAKNDYDYGW
jgi:hypothetical protein